MTATALVLAALALGGAAAPEAALKLGGFQRGGDRSAVEGALGVSLECRHRGARIESCGKDLGPTSKLQLFADPALRVLQIDARFDRGRAIELAFLLDARASFDKVRRTLEKRFGKPMTVKKLLGVAVAPHDRLLRWNGGDDTVLLGYNAGPPARLWLKLVPRAIR